MISRGQNKGVELDLLEDIFRQKERDLEKGILNFTLRDKGSYCLSWKIKKKTGEFTIRVMIISR